MSTQLKNFLKQKFAAAPKQSAQASASTGAKKRKRDESDDAPAEAAAHTAAATDATASAADAVVAAPSTASAPFDFKRMKIDESVVDRYAHLSPALQRQRAEHRVEQSKPTYATLVQEQLASRKTAGRYFASLSVDTAGASGGDRDAGEADAGSAAASSGAASLEPESPAERLAREYVFQPHMRVLNFYHYHSTCSVCGEDAEAHKTSRCPNHYCSLCYRFGHQEVSCPHADDSSVCDWCQGHGHDESQCTFRQFIVQGDEDCSDVTCFVCGSKGHLNCGKPKKKRDAPKHCFNCGSTQHEGFACTARRFADASSLAAGLYSAISRGAQISRGMRGGRMGSSAFRGRR